MGISKNKPILPQPITMESNEDGEIVLQGCHLGSYYPFFRLYSSLRPGELKDNRDEVYNERQKFSQTECSFQEQLRNAEFTIEGRKGREKIMVVPTHFSEKLTATSQAEEIVDEDGKKYFATTYSYRSKGTWQYRFADSTIIVEDFGAE